MVNTLGGEDVQDVELAIREIRAVQALNTRVKGDKNYHLMVSLRSGERPPAEVMADIEREFAQALGFGEHQRVAATHENTGNYHLHVAVNRVHPVTGKGHWASFDYRTLEEVSRAMEAKYGLEVDRGRSDVVEASRTPPGARDKEAQSWEQSFYGYVNWYVCIAVPIEGDLVAHILCLEIDNTYMHGWPREWPVYSTDWFERDRAGADMAQILKQHGWADKRVGLEIRREGCGGELYFDLFRELPTVTLVDATDVVLRNRIVKSEPELECLRRAAVLTQTGIKASFDVVRPGITDSEVAAAASEAMYRAGSEYTPIQPMPYTNRNIGPHMVPKRRIILPGDFFFIELTGNYNRYSAPCIRSASLGAPNDEIRFVLDCANATLEKLFELAKPGVPVCDLTRELVESMREGN